MDLKAIHSFSPFQCARYISGWRHEHSIHITLHIITRKHFPDFMVTRKQYALEILEKLEEMFPCYCW